MVKIEWDHLNETKKLLESSSLMNGEVKQLTSDEANHYNQILLSLVLRAEELHEIAQRAKQRFSSRADNEVNKTTS